MLCKNKMYKPTRFERKEQDVLGFLCVFWFRVRCCAIRNTCGHIALPVLGASHIAILAGVH